MPRAHHSMRRQAPRVSMSSRRATVPIPYAPEERRPGETIRLRKLMLGVQAPRLPFLDCARRYHLKMREQKAGTPRCVHGAHLKVTALVALVHPSCLDALVSIHLLPRENPSRLNNFLRGVAALSGFEYIIFLPDV